MILRTVGQNFQVSEFGLENGKRSTPAKAFVYEDGANTHVTGVADRTVHFCADIFKRMFLEFFLIYRNGTFTCIAVGYQLES